MLRRSRSEQYTVDEENPYWISFSDLMSGLLIVFILAAVALIIELTQTQQKIESDIQELKNAEQARRDILYEVRDELLRKDVLVEVADNDTVLRVPEQTLTFASNSDEIPRDLRVRNAVKSIGIALHHAINKPLNENAESKMRFQYLDTVFIEGHTDSLPTRRDKGNWGLSSYRAISLWEYWHDTVSLKPKFNDMVNAYGIKLFSVSGYAASRRTQIIENTANQRKRNRRIDIRFTIKRPSIADLEEIGK